MFSRQRETSADRRCVPISVPRSDDLPTGLTLLWAGSVGLEDIIRAATDTHSETASAGEPPAEPATATDGELPATADGERAATMDRERQAAPDIEGPAAADGQPVPVAEIAGRLVEDLAPGPELAQWLAAAPPGELNGFSLAGAAAAARRLTSWAQAYELAAVAEMAAHAAALDSSVPAGPDGGPAGVPEDAADEVALALCMSRFGAAWWTNTAITLAWRLPSTFAALRAGKIDLSRAKLIAEVTSVLDNDAARAVQDIVLPSAGEQTIGQLRAALRRALISVDPHGAETRREEAERRARISLYADEEGTATLSGTNLPGAQSAAAMARISALAQAMKSAGIAGGIELLRAQAFLGLLLGTLPLIPPSDSPDDPGPADPGPPDSSPPDSSPPDSSPPDSSSPDPSPPDPGPDDSSPHDPGPHDPGPDDPGPADPGSGKPGAGGRDGPGHRDPGAPSEPYPTGPSWPDLPLPGDAPDPGCAPSWPSTAANARGSPGVRGSPQKEPRARLLTVTVPWRTLAGLSGQPGNLCWLGPVTPSTALMLARTAAADPACEWRVIVIGPAGQAVAVTRVRGHRRRRAAAPGALISRVTLTIPAGILDGISPPALVDLDSLGALGEILRLAWQAAHDAARREVAGHEGAAPAATCSHQQASPSYRPADRLHDFVVARDQTCRFPRCRQPAWRGDLDHTVPYGEGGRTCSCNLGALCRTHHRLKQRLHWHLEQLTPGHMTWTTPAGRRYTATPDAHAA